MTHLTRAVHILVVYEKSGGQQLHQYQQNDHLLPKTIQHKKTTKYVVRNPDTGFRQAQQCGGVKSSTS